MKKNAVKTGFWNWLKRVFTKNAGLKILALVLAVLIYETLKQSMAVDQLAAMPDMTQN